jgi:hypothetical protein
MFKTVVSNFLMAFELNYGPDFVLGFDFSLKGFQDETETMSS